MTDVERGPAKTMARVAISARWGDMDSFGHVNNAQYLRYMEEARVQWLASLPGISLTDHIAPVLVASHINYRRPIKWPETIAIELFIEKVGNSSLTMAHRMLSSTDASVVYCDGSVVMAWINTYTGKSVALPAAVRAVAS